MDEDLTKQLPNNYQMLYQNEDFKYLLDRLVDRERETSLPNHYLKKLIEHLESLKGTSDDDIELTQDFMRRNQLKGDKVCFGDEKLFYCLISKRELMGRIGRLVGEDSAPSIIKRLENESSSQEGYQTIQKAFKSYKLIEPYDKNLSLRHMAVKPFLTWIFTAPSSARMENIENLVETKELQNRLGLESWNECQPYVLLKLKVPNSIVLHKPTIFDAGMRNRYFEVGGFTRPISDKNCGISEWVTNYIPSFQMIEYMRFIDIKEKIHGCP